MVSMKIVECKTCGGPNFVLPGKAAKLCHEDCIDCRNKKEDARKSLGGSNER